MHEQRQRWQATGRTAVAEPLVIDLRDGVDTVAVFQLARIQRATRAVRR